MSVWNDIKVSKRTPATGGNTSSPADTSLDVALPEIMRSRFKVESKIGSGAFGVALLVTSKTTSQKLVAKVMNISMMSDKDKGHVKSEVDCLGQCNHANIIKHIESCSDGRYLVLVTEYADGSDLGKELVVRARKNLTFSTKEISIIMVQLFLALDHAHSRGIIHRDVKPANIFFTKLGLVKLGDFGFSKHFEGTLSSPVGQTLCGTPYYLPPEMWLGQRYNKKVDEWSLGVVLYEMMTLRRPFAGENFKELGDNVRKGDFPELPAGHDPGLQQACHMLLTNDSGLRPDISEVIKLPVFQDALKWMKETISRESFAAVRESLTAHIDTFLTP
jgi:serine/threonine protein kinase